jgi:hypothetical protein
MALVMGKQCCNNARWKKLLYPENSGLYLIPIMQLKKNGREKKEKKSGLLFYEGLTHPSLLLCRPKGLSGYGKNDKNCCNLHFTRGLRRHRYYCVALRGFQDTGKMIKINVACILRGAYPIITIIV